MRQNPKHPISSSSFGMPARRRLRTFAPAMTIAAVLLLAAAPARAHDAHGAIAFGHIAQDEAVAYGFAWDYPSRDEAQEAAMNACLDSGGWECTVLSWFQNGCGALAIDQYGMAQGKGARSHEQAEARAVRTCEAAGGVGCAVVESQCVGAGGQPDTWSGSESVLAGPGEEGSGPTAGETADRDRPATDAPRDEGLTREERLQVQQGLAALGFDTGPADGMFGPRTRSAIREWQQAKGLEASGYLSREEAEVLAAAGREQAASRETAEPVEPGNQVLYFAAAGPKCAELGNLGERSAACWQEIQSQIGCYIWNEYYRSDRIADWTGECSGDTAHGRGSFSLSSSSGYSWTGFGSVMHGKQNGHWVERFSNDTVAEGPYVDGKWHGHWVLRFADGRVREGSWIDDTPHGHWVFRYVNGDVLEFEYHNGSREGQPGVYQTADGNRYPGRWSDECFRDAEGYAWAAHNKPLEECRP